MIPVCCHIVETLAGHAFISYVREDSNDVDSLQRMLEAAGVRVWRDTADLWPGEDWRIRIRRAITDNALVFIACFSSRSIARVKSYQNEELVLAIEQMRMRSPDVPWLIPVRFDDCVIPDLEVGGGRTLASIQRADLFGIARDIGIARLVAAILRALGPSTVNTETEQSERQDTDVETDGAAPEKKRTSAVMSRLKVAARDPLDISGENSKLLEIDMARGAYRMSWTAKGRGLFSVRDESARGGDGKLIANGVVPKTSSGEAIVRVETDGRRIISVEAPSIAWTIIFTYL